LAGTAVGRGKRVRRRTEPGAGCCYGDVEDEEEEEPWAGAAVAERSRAGFAGGRAGGSRRSRLVGGRADLAVTAGGRAGGSRRSHRGGFADRDSGGMHGAVAAGRLDGGRAGREIAAVLRRAGGSRGCGMHGRADRGGGWIAGVQAYGGGGGLHLGLNSCRD
jgi:hypothetical protein